MVGRCLLTVGVMLTALAGMTTASDVKETVRITVTGESVRHAIAVDDPTLLAASNVYSGRFIDAPAVPPDSRHARYRLSFDIQTLDGIKSGAYVLYYVHDTASGNGYLYLPGEQDAEYHANRSTILRAGMDGTWHYASPSWTRLLNAFLPAD